MPADNRPLPGEPGHPSYISPAAAGGFTQANLKFDQAPAAEKARRKTRRSLTNLKKATLVRKANAKYRRGRKKPHSRTRGIAIAQSYPVQVATHRRFLKRFREMREQEPGFCWHNHQGEQTAWTTYRCIIAWANVKDPECHQTFRTSANQQAVAMAHKGRPRVARTMQRTYPRLARMGYIDRQHVRKQRGRDGHRDCLEITLINVVPPLAAPPPPTAEGGATAVGSDNCPQEMSRPPPAAKSAAPDGAGSDNSSTQKGGAEPSDRLPNADGGAQDTGHAPREPVPVDEARRRVREGEERGLLP